jgi:hypothetical protein
MFCTLGRSPKIPKTRASLAQHFPQNTNYNNNNNNKQLILVFAAPLLDEFGLTKSNAHPILARMCMTPAVKLCIFEETAFCIVLSIIEFSVKSYD